SPLKRGRAAADRRGSVVRAPRWSRDKGGALSGRIWYVRKVETLPWSRASRSSGRPIVRGAESLGGTGCSRSKCRLSKGNRKPNGVVGQPLPLIIVGITGRIPTLGGWACEGADVNR